MKLSPRRGFGRRRRPGRFVQWLVIPGLVVGAALAGADVWTGTSAPSIDQSRRSAIVEAAERVGPAVVAVHTLSRQVVQARSPFEGHFFQDFFAPRFYEKPVTGMGSGVILDARGYLVTNDHVIAGAEQLRVSLSDGRSFNADLVGVASSNDLALLRIQDPPENLPSAKLGNSDDLLIGEWAVAIGNPFGDLIDDPQPTVTAGVVSAMHRDVKSGADSGRVYRDMIQTDASINPGNSGGALVNGAGEIIGINTFIFSRSGGSLGIGFAIPSNRVRKIIVDLLEHGVVRPVWTGIMSQHLEPAMARALDLPNAQGALVAAVVPESPADRAGLAAGDVLIHMGRRAVRSVLDLELVLAQMVVGEKLEISFVRAGRTLSAQVELEERPLREGEQEIATLGVRGRDLRSERGSARRGKSVGQGVLLTYVDRTGTLGSAGLEVGDIIRGLGRWEIHSMDDLSHLVTRLPSGSQVAVIVQRNRRMFQAGITIR